jgi:hypothetical protein
MAEKEKVRDLARKSINPNFYAGESFIRFNMQGTPTAMLADQTGEIRETYFGVAPHLEDAIEDLLKKAKT